MDDDRGGYRQINKSLNICAFDDYLKGQTAGLPEIASVEQLTQRVLRILGQNPGKFTFQGTNVYVVGTGSHRIMIDTGGGEPAWATLVQQTFTALEISLSAVLLTHWHGDHTGGVPDLLRMYPDLKDRIYKNVPDKGQQDIADGQIFKVEGATVRALHVPGHSEDHMCFILEEEQAMMTGDNVLGTGSSAVEDLGTFMASLQKMYDQGCGLGYSAHGVTVENLPQKIGRELGQKMRRERQVLQALQQAPKRSVRSLTVKDVVTEIYGQNVDQQTRTLALEPFIDEVLRKLAGDGKVAFEMRGGQKKWYVPKAVHFSLRSEDKAAARVQVEVLEVQGMSL